MKATTSKAVEKKYQEWKEKEKYNKELQENWSKSKHLSCKNNVNY